MTVTGAGIWVLMSMALGLLMVRKNHRFFTLYKSRMDSDFLFPLSTTQMIEDPFKVVFSPKVSPDQLLRLLFTKQNDPEVEAARKQSVLAYWLTISFSLGGVAIPLAAEYLSR